MLELKQVSKTFSQGSNSVEAVKNVDFRLDKGEFCALVGESGSGKTTLSRILMGLIAPTAGQALLDDKNITPRGIRHSRELYAKIQLVLQDGQSALDPRFTVFDSIAEPIRNLMRTDKRQLRRRVSELMDQMELPENLLGRKPAELSGGQQKRVCIARALAVKPDYIIFDESSSGLDVIVRKSILDLLLRLHHELGGGYLFITHDMDVALYLASRVLVMKDGKIVEQAAYAGNTDVFTHPYSKLLLSAMVPAPLGRTG